MIVIIMITMIIMEGLLDPSPTNRSPRHPDTCEAFDAEDYYIIYIYIHTYKDMYKFLYMYYIIHYYIIYTFNLLQFTCKHIHNYYHAV